jgi:hypothetical protein
VWWRVVSPKGEKIERVAIAMQRIVRRICFHANCQVQGRIGAQWSLWARTGSINDEDNGLWGSNVP